MLVIQSKQLYKSENWGFSIHINKESRFGEENTNHENCKQVSTSYTSQIFQAHEVGAGESRREIELIKLLLGICLMINCEVVTPIGSQKFRRGKALPKERPWYSQINLFLSLPVGNLATKEPFIWNPVMWFQFKLLSVSLSSRVLQQTWPSSNVHSYTICHTLPSAA